MEGSPPGALDWLLGARDRDLRWAELVLAAAFPLSLLPFATVHPGWRFTIALIAGLLGALAVVRGVATRKVGRPALLVFGPALAAMGIATLAALPAGPGLRDFLMPGLADGLSTLPPFSTAEVTPLALDPRRGLLEWGITLQWLLLAAGLGFLVRDSRKAARVARLAVGTGIGLVVIALAHRLTGAEHIWWVSETPGFARDPFFAPFVNPNHGGICCAALAPVALATAARDRGPAQAFGVVGAILLTVGVLASGSRGALLALAAGTVPMALLVLGKKARIGVAVLGGFLLLMVLGYGVEPSLRALSEFLVPDALSGEQDVYTGRGDIYGDALAVVRSAPMLGVGHGGFDDAFRALKTSTAFTDPVHAHQELIQIAGEHGVVVAMLWTFSFITLLVVGFQAAFNLESARRRLMLAGWLGTLCSLAAAAQFTFPLRIGALEVLAAIASGSVLGLAQISVRDTPKDVPRKLAISGAVIAAGLLSMGGWLATSASETSLLGQAEAAETAGDQAMRSGDLLAAQQAYALALRRKPVNRAVLQKLARSYDKQGDLAMASQAIDAATRLQPGSPWPWRDKARIERTLGLYDASRESYRRFLALDLPESARRDAVSEALRGPGKPRKIAESVLPPDNADLLVLAARVIEESGDKDGAEIYFTRAFELDPRYGAALGAALLRWKRRPERVLEILTQTPESCHAQEVKAQALFKMDDFNGASAVWTDTLGACASEDEAMRRRIRIGLARCQIGLRNPEGLQTLETMAKENPLDAGLWRALARDARGERDPARLQRYLESLAEATELTPAEDEQLTLLRLNMPMFVVLDEDVPGREDPKDTPKKGGKGGKGTKGGKGNKNKGRP